MRWLACVAIAGCTATLDTTVLRVDPAALDIDVSLGMPAPSTALRVFLHDTDVTAAASLALDDASLGTLAGATFTPAGDKGGAATIAVSADGITARVPVAVRVHAVRFLGGVPASSSTVLAPGNNDVI